MTTQPQYESDMSKWADSVRQVEREQLSGTLIRDTIAFTGRRVDENLPTRCSSVTGSDPLQILFNVCNHLADQITDRELCAASLNAWFDVKKVIEAFIEGETRTCGHCGKLRTQHLGHRSGLDYCKLPCDLNDNLRVLSPYWEPCR